MDCASPHFSFEIFIFFCIMQFVIKREFVVEKTATFSRDWKFHVGLTRWDLRRFILKLEHSIPTTNGITKSHSAQIRRRSMLAPTHRLPVCSGRNAWKTLHAFGWIFRREKMIKTRRTLKTFSMVTGALSMSAFVGCICLSRLRLWLRRRRRMPTKLSMKLIGVHRRSPIVSAFCTSVPSGVNWTWPKLPILLRHSSMFVYIFKKRYFINYSLELSQNWARWRR